MEQKPPSGLIQITGRLMNVPKQVAIALRRFAIGNTHLLVGELFGVADSTSTKICKRFIKALLKTAIPLHLKWPEGESLSNVKLGFEKLHGIPQCCGALDCSHVRFNLPAHAKSTDWYDRDHNYSTIIQAIVDHKGRYVDVFVGIPRSVYDSRVYLLSNHCKEVLAGTRLSGPTIEIGGVDVQELVVADAGYLGDKNVLVPWAGMRLPRLYDEFNFKQSSTHIVVEREFGILKGMWRILKAPMISPNLEKVLSLILACCILHNIVIDRNDEIDESIVLWGHHDQGYRQQVVKTPPQNDAKQLQMAIAWHLYDLEALQFNE